MDTLSYDISEHLHGPDYKFNGKENQTVSSMLMLDYGARMFDSRFGRWLMVDPLADSYYSVSPYVYCINDPISYIDWDGREVIALNSVAQRAILNTLPKEVRSYVVFDKNGRIDKSILNYVSSTSGNFAALSQLVNDNRIFEVSVTDKIIYKDETGELIERSMGEIFLSDDKNGDFGFNTGEEGWMGVTQTPGNAPEKYNSSDDNVKIVVNSGLSTEGQAQMFSHEAYGHAYLYSKGETHVHQIISTSQGFRETNKRLEEAIRRAIEETIKNMLGI